MKIAARIALLLIALLAGLVSLLSLYWWSIRSVNVLAGHGVIESARELLPNALIQFTDQQILIVRFREYFAVFGGFIGWASLVALLVFADRSLGALPKWVIGGCVVGVAAAIALPSGGIYAYPPIVMAAALLLRCYLAKPNPLRIETTRRAVSAGRFNPLFKKPGESPGIFVSGYGKCFGRERR